MDAPSVTMADLQALFRRQGLERAFTEQEPLLRWPEVVGEQMGRLTRPLRVRTGVLHVETANSVVAQQLTLLKADYLRAMNDRLETGQLTDIRFQVGDLPAPSPQPDRTDDGTDPEQLELGELGELGSLLCEIADPQMRATFERWMRHNIRHDQARKRAGGRACPRCGVHHEEAGELCYFCRLEGEASWA